MKINVVVLASYRPEYLYVALDSLFRVRGIDECKVFLWADGFKATDPVGFGQTIRSRTLVAASDFPVYSVVLDKERRGILGSYIPLMDLASKDEPDYVLYLQDDIILRTDTLEYLETAVRKYNSFFYGLLEIDIKPGELVVEKKDRYGVGGFNSWGYLISPASYRFLRSQLLAKTYLGDAWKGNRYWPSGADLIDRTEQLSRMDDAALGSISAQHNLAYLVPDRNYSAHFGARGGVACLWDGDTKKVLPMPMPHCVGNFEAEIFHGDKSAWLDNLIKVYSQRVCIPELRVFPKSFDYA